MVYQDIYAIKEQGAEGHDHKRSAVNPENPHGRLSALELRFFGKGKGQVASKQVADRDPEHSQSDQDNQSPCKVPVTQPGGEVDPPETVVNAHWQGDKSRPCGDCSPGKPKFFAQGDRQHRAAGDQQETGKDQQDQGYGQDVFSMWQEPLFIRYRRSVSLVFQKIPGVFPKGVRFDIVIIDPAVADVHPGLICNG